MTDDDSPAPLNPWLSVWTRPRATIRQIVQTDPTRWVLVIAGLAGIGNALDRASKRNLGDRQPVEVVVCAALLLGPVGGVIGLYFLALLLRWTGTWIGGRASAVDMRAAVAWAAVPTVFSLTLWVPALMLAGRELFTTETPELDNNPAAALGLVAVGLVGMALGVWSLVLLVKCVGEVQGFSAWKALGNVLLAGLVVVVPIALLLVAVVAMR